MIKKMSLLLNFSLALLCFMIDKLSVFGIPNVILPMKTKLGQRLSPFDFSSHYTVVTLQGSAQPAFFNPNNDNTTIVQQQQQICQDVKARFPDAQIIGSTHKVMNTITVSIPQFGRYNQDAHFRGIDGIQNAFPQQILHPDLNYTVDAIGSERVNKEYCVTGKGVKIAVLDTGIDYTHEAFGGPGTVAAYERAYGTYRDSPRNKQRDGLFPTERVYGGFDFLGERYHEDRFPEFEPNDDPLDNAGHGTLVASNIVAVAPDAQLLAVKVCRRDLCPTSPVLQGIEYALDPNQDGSMDDAVDIINFSFGIGAFSAFHFPIAAAIENAVKLGVICVNSGGNRFNRPFIAGSPATTPNGITVGATENPGDPLVGRMAIYSSRGPGENHQLKPDISAPAENVAAESGTGNGYRASNGTSFSAPIIAGAAALLRQKCPSCSPLAIKALLMNNAYRDILQAQDDYPAPLSWMGAGEVRIQAALNATFWAYSPDSGDVQPSISLGLVNAASDIIIRRSIRIMSLLNDETQSLEVTTWIVFRNKTQEETGALSIVIDSSNNTGIIVLSRNNDDDEDAGCEMSAIVNVTFMIDASKAPTNRLDSGRDPNDLNHNEFDGYVMIRSVTPGETHEIGVPFHMILRQASNVSISMSSLPMPVNESEEVLVSMKNHGAGIAQVDAYELLLLSDDAEEAVYGGGDGRGDFRSIGYRTIESPDKEGCRYTLEFVANLWERPLHLSPTSFNILFDTDIDFQLDKVALTRQRRNDLTSEVILLDGETDNVTCTKFGLDHGVSSSNIVLRVCAEMLGITEFPTIINANFGIIEFPFNGTVPDDITTWLRLEIPSQFYSAESVDMRPGEVLDNVPLRYLQRENSIFSRFGSFGYLFTTNGFRTDTRTGASIPEAETLLIPLEGRFVPQEVVPDVRVFPEANRTDGPKCGEWSKNFCEREELAGESSPSAMPSKNLTSMSPSVSWTDYPSSISPTEPTGPSSEPSLRPSCESAPFARVRVPTVSPTVSPSMFPSEVPSPMDLSEDADVLGLTSSSAGVARAMVSWLLPALFIGLGMGGLCCLV